MNLKKLLCAIDYTIIQGDFDVEISDIIYDSRKVEEGSLFVCLKGYNADGHKYAPEAASKGAAALLVSDDVDINNKNVTIIKVNNTPSNYLMAIISFVN